MNSLFLLLIKRSIKICYLILLISPFTTQAQSNTLLYPSIVTFAEIPTIKLSTSVADSLITINELNDSKLTWKFAVSIPVNISSQNAGIWTHLTDGRWVWYCKIFSRKAFSLRPFVDSIKLAEGACLRMFNATISQIETLDNTQQSISPVPGDMILLELIEPASQKHSSSIYISSVAHDYKNFFNAPNMRGTAGSCNVDVNCPKGDNWQLEKRSICKILFQNNEVCTGTLINNTSNDQTPYILTANHCIKGSTFPATAIFYFNYESDSCGTIKKTTSIDTVKGSKLIAGPLGDSVDFSLLKLNRMPVSTIFPYFAGWSRADKSPAQTTVLHHPRGDVTKISVSYRDSVLTGDFVELTYRLPKMHWRIKSWQVGTTEGGSSGAALFDSDSHLIVGSLSGGDANCTSPRNDYFAKFSVNWAFFPNPENQLKPWLDPQNTGMIECQGLDVYQTTQNPTTNITKEDTLIIANTGAKNKGIWTGKNMIPITAIAERFAGLPNRYICAVKFPIAELSDTMVAEKVILKIWNGTSAPQQVLYAHEIGTKNVIDGKYCYIKLAQPIRTNGTFFVGLSFENLSASDQFAMYSTLDRKNKQNSAYGFCRNTWGSFKEMGYPTALALEIYTSALNECKDTILNRLPARFKSNKIAESVMYATKELFAIDSIQNFKDADKYVLSVFPDKWGYCSGNNGYGFSAFAEKIRVNDMKYINGIKVALAKKSTLNQTARVSFCLWGATTSGYPGSLLFQQAIHLDSLRKDSFNIVRLPAPKFVDSICFAGIKLTDLNGIDTFAIYQSVDSISACHSYYFHNNEWQYYSLSNVKNKLAIGVSTCYSAWYIDERPLVSYYPLPVTIETKPQIVKNDITLCPNNAKNITTVTIHVGNLTKFDKITAQLQTVCGQQTEISVFNVSKESSSAQIDISALPAGMYFLIIEIDDKQYMKHLIIQ